MVEEHAARRKQRHAPRRPLKELRADLIFERADVPTERRLRYAKTTSGASDVAPFGDGDEVANLRKAHDAIVPVTTQRSKTRRP